MQTHSRALWKPRVNPLSFLNTKLQNFWPRPRTSKSSNCWEHNTVTCASGKPSLCECSRDLPPSSSSPAGAAQAGPGECHTWDTPMEPWGAATGKYNPKTTPGVPLFHHHLKEREGNLCKVLKGAGQWWWLHEFHQNPGAHCSMGSRGAAKLTVATAPMRNRAKQQGKDLYIRQISPSHLQGAQGAATGIKSRSQGCADGICLLPSCCYFLQTGTANPPPVTPP